jgi:DNA-binding IclR family transcriptional regulator
VSFIDIIFMPGALFPGMFTTVRAPIYSRSRRVFAGISVSGAALRHDFNTNKKLYGRLHVEEYGFGLRRFG